MALVVEDGTGVANANAFTISTFIDSYFSDRGIVTWAGTQAVKDAAIISATDFIELRWAKHLNGRIEFPDTPQALSFPRLDLFNMHGSLVLGIPLKLQYAVAEYALIALTSALMPTPEMDKSGLKIKRKKDKTGPLEDDIEYTATFIITRPYPKADSYMAEYVTVTSKVIR